MTVKPQHLLAALGTTALVLNLAILPTWAKDPFRTSNPKAIGDRTSDAFVAMFEKGDYKTAEGLVAKAAASESNEPLVYAMKAILAFNSKQPAEFSSNATQTHAVAQQLIKTDPLRGNLYVAVGSFLEGASILSNKGIVRGTPEALGKLQEATQGLDAAEKIAPQDPELGLIKGAMDLMLAVNINLPLSDPQKAIARLEGAAGPKYLADRTLAWGYRDLNDLGKAMKSVDDARSATPGNPELDYLKAQIAVKQGNDSGALPLFKAALDKSAQLPPSLVEQIQREERRAKQRLGKSAK
jgi:tetratricopeptide (TPR) repeat protein